MDLVQDSFGFGIAGGIMARVRGRLALYEVINKGKLAPKDGRLIAITGKDAPAGTEKAQQQESEKDQKLSELEKAQMHLEFEEAKVKPEPELKVEVLDQPAEIQEVKPKAEPEKPLEKFHWPKMPKVVQLNNGRVEFSMHWQLAVAVSLAAVLLILVAYWAGQKNGVAENTVAVEQAAVATIPVRASAPATTATTGNSNVVVTQPVNTSSALPVGPLKGDYRVLIAYATTERDLQPVKDFYARNNINTIVEKEGQGFCLVTADTYESSKTGSDGELALNKIRKIGISYKAPPGYGTYPNKFSDAYLKKNR